MYTETEAGFMVRYTIDNDAYDGVRIAYSTCQAPKLTSTTLNTNVITWDRLITKTRHTTSLDTIPGTTSTTQVDTTQTYKCEVYTYTTSTNVNKDEYMSFYIARTTATYVPPSYVASDNYQNRIYTDSYTAIVSDSIPGAFISVTMQNGYNNKSSGSSSSSTSRTYTYSSWEIGMSTSSTRYPDGHGGWIDIPSFSMTSKTVLAYSSSSSSFSSSWKEGTAFHALGTTSISLPLGVGYTTQTNTTTMLTNYYTSVVSGSTVSYSSYVTSNTTSIVAAGNTTSMKFTTEGGLPQMSVVFNSSVINNAILSYQNYNIESSLFYLGTLLVNVSTQVTSEREVQ